jgi:hypothetical protein
MNKPCSGEARVSAPIEADPTGWSLASANYFGYRVSQRLAIHRLSEYGRSGNHWRI